MSRLLHRGVAALRRRPALAAALLYAVLAMLMVGPALLPGKTLSNSDMTWFQPPWVGVKPAELEMPTNTELGDAPGQLQPFLGYAADRVPDVPLWNPHIVGGRPFLANAQSALFSPYSAPAYVLPFWTALSWIGVLKLWVSAFGMFLLGRALGMRFGGALMAGVVYAFSLWMVTWLSYPHMSVWSWIPWMLLLTDRLVRRPDVLSGAGLAAVIAAQLLGGHPESSFHALVATLAFLVLRLVQRRRTAGPASSVGRTVLAFAAAGIGGFALAALTIVPFAELLWNSADLHDRMGDAVDKQPILRDFALGIFLPDYWGRATATPIKLFVLDRALYVGALPLMLAAAALIIRPSLERVGVALFGGLWLAVLFGIAPFLHIVTRLPVFSSGHNSRLAVLYVLAVALLAGWGLDDLTTGRWRAPRRRLVLAVAAALVAVPALFVLGAGRTSLSAFGDALEVAWGFATPPGAGIGDTGGRNCVEPCLEAGDVIRLASLLGWLAVAAAGLCVVALRLRRRLGAAAFAAIAVALVCVDLFHAGMGYNPAIDRDVATQPATGAIRLLERNKPSRFVSMEHVPQNIIPMRFGLYEARGYDLPIMRRYDRLWRREISPESASVAEGLLDIPLTVRELTPRALRSLRLLGVTHVLQPRTYPSLDLPGMRLVYDGPDARVYRVEGALSRAFVVPAQRVVSGGGAALDAVTEPDFDGRAVGVTEERVPGVPVEGEAGPTPGGSAEITRYAAERVDVRARSPGPGLLVLGDNYYPGWTAEVDGRPAAIARVDYLFRGVRIGPGSHMITFRYEPLTWTIGWIVTSVSAVLLAVAVAVGARRRRRGAPPAAATPDEPEPAAGAVPARH
ncbi:MAG: YfhO family protein [Thermoleophilaceae bacterium]|nr:YfhO family protein [Thermoleophilaceae bacterium]